MGIDLESYIASLHRLSDITYLGTNRLEARQGIDCYTLVIHAAALGVGQHIHEIVHLRSRATL